MDVNPTVSRKVGAFQQRLHALCREVRGTERISRICNDALEVVRDMRTQGGGEEWRVMATLQEITDALAERVDNADTLTHEHVAALMQNLEGCGEVLCLDAHRQKECADGEIRAEERIVLDVRLFSNHVLGQLFSHDMFDQLSATAPVGNMPHPVNIRAGHESRYLVSARTLNSWALMPSSSSSEESSRVCDLLFALDGETRELVLPRLLEDMHWCVRVPPDAPDDTALWLPLFLLDDLRLPDMEVQTALHVPDALADSQVWVRVGRRVRCAHEWLTVLPHVMMRAQAHLVSRYGVSEEATAEAETKSGDGSADGPNADWNVRLYHEAAHVFRDTGIAWDGERTRLLVRRVLLGTHEHVLDVYVSGSLSGPADVSIPEGQHRLQALCDEVADVLVGFVPTTAKARIHNLRLSDDDVRAMQTTGCAPPERGGTTLGYVHGDTSAADATRALLQQISAIGSSIARQGRW